MNSLVNKYLIKRTLRELLIAFLIITSIILLIDYVETSRNIGQDFDVNNSQLLHLTLLKAPSLIEQTIPFVVLFGIMAAFFGLNKRSELIVLRASGMSAWNFLSPVIAVTFVLGIVWATCFNPLAAKSFNLYEYKLSQIDDRNISNSNIWLREVTSDSQTLINARKYDPQTLKLHDVFISQSEITAEGAIRFRARFDSESADLLSAGYWQLYNVTENTNDINTKIIKHDVLSIPTSISIEDILSQNKSNSITPFWSIQNQIKQTNRVGFSTVKLEMQWHKLLSLPISLVAMTFIAAAVSMSLTRSGGTLRLLISGTAIGFIVFFMTSVFNALGESTSIPIITAAWAIPIMTFFLGVYYLSKIEDG